MLDMYIYIVTYICRYMMYTYTIKYIHICVNCTYIVFLLMDYRLFDFVKTLNLQLTKFHRQTPH